MKRVIIICEGETEQEFCKKILAPFFWKEDISIHNPRIKKSMGGIVFWKVLKKDILNHLKNDPTAFVTTFIDYYGLQKKHSFPNWSEAEAEREKNRRMELLEKGMKHDIGEAYNSRFIPYVQLHEFEGLLFNDINVFYNQFEPEELIGEKELRNTFNEFNDNPEMINNGRESAPSKRLERIIKGYDKIVFGNIIAEEIGIERIRSKSPRFSHWIAEIIKI